MTRNNTQEELTTEARGMVLSSSTAVTLYVPRHSVINPTPKSSTVFLNPLVFRWKQPHRLIIVRNSGDVSAETPATEAETETSIEAPQGPPSLINALNVERALRGIAITDVDHYARLGLPRGCPYDRVTVAYESKVAELLNQGLDEEQLRKEMELLKESYNILSRVEERRLYDWSLARSEEPDRYAWPFEVDITQIPTQPPPPQEPEDTGPTRLVGYFMLAWILISFVLSAALNR